MILREPGCLDAKVVCSSYLTVDRASCIIYPTQNHLQGNVVVGTLVIIQRTLLESPIPSAERCPSKAYGQELNMRLAALLFHSPMFGLRMLLWGVGKGVVQS